MSDLLEQAGINQNDHRWQAMDPVLRKQIADMLESMEEADALEWLGQMKDAMDGVGDWPEIT